MIIIRAMDPYELLWMVLLIVFVLGELATIGLTCIWFAAGALAALVMAMAGVNPVVQFLVFLVVSILFACCNKTVANIDIYDDFFLFVFVICVSFTVFFIHMLELFNFFFVCICY